ncbi:MAG: ferritin, partial [Ignavibacteria bacterium]|nr:ferritin [Ignavibacteria bacterium]
MLTKKMEKALNDQINAELYSSYLYLSMASFFESQSWLGFAKWMELQAAEEYAHGMKFYKHINEMGGRAELQAIEKPKAEWSSLVQVFEEAHKHELYITERINNLVEVAAAEKDHATGIFLQWFVTEQVEEVA